MREQDEELWKAVLSKDRRRIEAAVARGGDVNVVIRHDASEGRGVAVRGRPDDGVVDAPILMTPVLRGDIETAETLLDLGADVKGRDNMYGRTALHHALIVMSDDNGLDMVRMLIRRGSDVRAKDSMDQAPMDVLADSARDAVAASDRVRLVRLIAAADAVEQAGGRASSRAARAAIEQARRVSKGRSKG